MRAATRISHTPFGRAAAGASHEGARERQRPGFGETAQALFWLGIIGLGAWLAPLALEGARLLALEALVALFHLAGWPWP